jgi:hypothetical protein
MGGRQKQSSRPDKELKAGDPTHGSLLQQDHSKAGPSECSTDRSSTVPLQQTCSSMCLSSSISSLETWPTNLGIYLPHGPRKGNLATQGYVPQNKSEYLTRTIANSQVRPGQPIHHLSSNRLLRPVQCAGGKWWTQQKNNSACAS